jgi:O-antigen/teichoic acid export membrane protein
VAFIMTVTSVAAQPRISALHSGSTPGALREFFRSARLGSFLATLAVGAALAAFGRPVLALFGAEFVAGYPALLILIAGHIVAAAFGPLTAVLIMTGRQTVAALVQVGSVALCVALLAALVPRWGIEGAAAASAASLVLSQLFAWWFASSRPRSGAQLPERP